MSKEKSYYCNRFKMDSKEWIENREDEACGEDCDCCEYAVEYDECNHDWQLTDNYDDCGSTVCIYICTKCGEESEERSW